MTTIIHLIRHASHDLLGRVLVGRAPVPISATGLAEAAALGRRLADRPLAAVISSPQLRAQQTAEAIAAHSGQAVTVDGAWDEIDFGAWTGLRFDVLQHDAGWQAFNSLRGFASIPDGETMLAAQARAVASLLRLRLTWPDHEVAVVSHGDVLKSVLAHVLGMPLDFMRRVEVAPSSRSVVTLCHDSAIVQAVNLRE